MPLVSIVTVCYNSVSLLEETIKSVIQQTYEHLEYIIIDGGSVDGTIDIIKKYQGRISYWISEPDNGVYDAMNKAIAVANGDWILFMNSGDRFFSNNVISNVFSSTNKNSDVVYGKTIVETTSGRFIVNPEPIEHIMYHLPFCHQSTFVRTTLMKAHPFDLSFKYVADFNFFYNLYKENKVYEFVDYPISCYKIDEGLTASNMFACYLENYKVNGYKVSCISVLQYKIRNYLLSVLPKGVVQKIRARLYMKNCRFTKID